MKPGFLLYGPPAPSQALFWGIHSAQSDRVAQKERGSSDPLSQSGPGAPAQPQIVQPTERSAFGSSNSVFGEASNDDRMVSGVIVTGSN